MNRNFNHSMLQTPVRSAKNLQRANSGLKPVNSNQRLSTRNADNPNPYTVKNDLTMFTDTTKENIKALSPSPTNKNFLMKSTTSLNKSTVDQIKNGMTSQNNETHKSTGNLLTMGTAGMDNESLRVKIYSLQARLKV